MTWPPCLASLDGSKVESGLTVCAQWYTVYYQHAILPHAQPRNWHAQAIAEEIAQDEIAHVRYLRKALGDDAVAIPQLDIGDAFTAAANAAFGATLSPPSLPISTRSSSTMALSSSRCGLEEL